jgi:hypothetical protein
MRKITQREKERRFALVFGDEKERKEKRDERDERRKEFLIFITQYL